MPKQWKRKRNKKFRCWVKKSLIVYDDDEQQQGKKLKKERIGKNLLNHKIGKKSVRGSQLKIHSKLFSLKCGLL